MLSAKGLELIRRLELLQRKRADGLQYDKPGFRGRHGGRLQQAFIDQPYQQLQHVKPRGLVVARQYLRSAEAAATDEDG
jgi:hypothetical protein